MKKEFKPRSLKRILDLWGFSENLDKIWDKDHDFRKNILFTNKGGKRKEELDVKPKNRVVIPGKFETLHTGHIKLAEAAQMKSGLTTNEIIFETSRHLVSKNPAKDFKGNLVT